MKKTFPFIKTTITLSIILLIISPIPTGIGDKHNISGDKLTNNEHNILNYNYSVFSTVDRTTTNIYNSQLTQISNKNSNVSKIISNVFVEGPWPMYCHDVRHTGQSPYSTAGNFGVEKWRCDLNNWQCFGSPIIDKENVIYVGASDMFAIYPNSTKKWEFNMGGIVVSAPVIDKNEVLYFGTIWGEYIYALYANNGTEKWRYLIGNTWASSTVGSDGIIYAPATDNWNIIAFYPNGTVKWSFHANERVFSSPAIGDDGTVYCTSYGAYLYALYPENGTVKWQYNTGGSVRTSACIADDGTIYVVSVNGVLHALYPNGTLKWQASIDGGTSPTIGNDGTIYCGYHQLYAINPDGSQKWVFNPGNIGEIKEGTPCNSLDGTIYFGTYASNGGDLIAVNPDGTERWRLHLASGYIMSAPAIGSDGTVYVGSVNDGTLPYSYGYLHAIGPLDPNAPSAPVISGPTKCINRFKYEYSFKSVSPVGNNVYYNIDWGDIYPDYLVGPYKSGEQSNITNKRWYSFDVFTIRARAIDSQNLCSNWSEYKVTTPRNKAISDSLFPMFLERFLLLKKLLNFQSICN